jgi:hypothetical protein
MVGIRIGGNCLIYDRFSHYKFSGNKSSDRKPGEEPKNRINELQ